MLDLFARRAVGWAFSLRTDADLVVQALEMAYQQRVLPQGLVFHSDQGQPVRQSKIPSALVALPDTAEYEPSGKLLEYLAYGTAIPQP